MISVKSKQCRKEINLHYTVCRASQRETERLECEMSYLLSVANDRPMLRLSATIVLAFTCAAPLVLLLSGAVAYGVDSLIR